MLCDLESMVDPNHWRSTTMEYNMHSRLVNVGHLQMPLLQLLGGARGSLGH